MGKNVRRLYTLFRPEHYDLDLSIYPEELTFEGTVTISGHKTGRSSQRLVLHQKGLKITSAQLTKHDKKGDRQIAVDRINRHGRFDEVRLHCTEKLAPGAYSLQVTFKGRITRQMNGMYPCFFTHDGHEDKLIATQFESHHAREVFPCVDEPEAKATFDLRLETPEAGVTISNTPLKSEEVENGRRTCVFARTPKMSTYLLAFVHGDMAFKEAKTKDDVLIRCYATKDNIEFTGFALDFAVKCLELYNQYFAIPYPLEKCDLVALPDFAAGAMENWGCITFREQAMLVDPANTSLATKQHVAMVVAHELAHQWFGNLVTMRWWTDLWLNEGFASWIEHLAVDEIYPGWQMWTQFIVDEQQPALKLDSLEHTHPVEVPVGHPDEIRTIFDTISYSKGASVIHMLHQYLGSDDFRDGLRAYLKQHSYANTDTTDLWNALAVVSGKPVREFMQMWTTASGFPIVHARVAPNTLELTQERFFVNPAARDNSRGTGAIWPVPLLAERTSGSILDGARLNLKGNFTEYKLNRGQSGYYRVIYDARHLKKLGAMVSRGAFGPLDRLGILTDAFEAAKAGYTDSVSVLRLLEAYAAEDNAAVWDIIAGGLSGIRAIIDDEKTRDRMKPFTRNLADAQLKRLGWKPRARESHFDSLLRPTILGLASFGEDHAVVEEALKRFKAMRRPEDIEPDIRGVVYGTAVRHGGSREYEKLIRFHHASASSEERVNLAAAVTGFKQPGLIKKALACIDTEEVRLQDVAYWVAYSFVNRHAKKLTWEWLTAHWSWLESNLGSDLSFTRFPIYAARAFSDRSFIKSYKDFFEPRLNPGLERSFRQGVEVIEWQSDWKRRDLDALTRFFEAQS